MWRAGEECGGCTGKERGEGAIYAFIINASSLSNCILNVHLGKQTITIQHLPPRCHVHLCAAVITVSSKHYFPVVLNLDFEH